MALTRYIIIFLTASFLPSCGFRTKIIAELAGGPGPATVSKVTPLAAKPGDIVKISGQNFIASKNLKARIVLTDGSTRDLPLSIADRNSASFVMPEGAGLGMRSVSVIERKSTAVGSFNLIANQQDNKLPILIDEQSEICSTKEYIDINGDRKTGTKDCTTGSSSKPDCSADGQAGCVTTSSFVAANSANLVASNIKHNVQIGGVTGSKRDIKQCRNAADLTTFDASSFTLNEVWAGPLVPNGAADIWDTIEDYNAFKATSPSQGPWGASYVCDSSNFTNVSASGDTSLTPPNTPVGGTYNFSQIWRDDLTGLYFTNILYDGSGAVDWEGAMSMCSGLDSGDGTGKWRLPTQKELMQLYVDGISKVTVAGGGWASLFMWSSSAVSGDTDLAWIVYLAFGSSNYDDRSSTNYGVFCVR